MKKIKKVIIKTDKGELTDELIVYATIALGWFKADLASEKYGKDWDSCHYGYQGLHAITKLNKSGSITITVE